MATKHTTNYQLNLWEPNDAFLRTEFNENSNKIDAALAAHDDTLAQLPGINNTLSSHTAMLAEHTSDIAARTRFYIGTYSGTGKRSRIITCPFPPKFVFVSMDSYGGAVLAVIRGQRQALATGHTEATLDISWSGNSVTIAAAAEGACYFDLETYNYCYFALG